MFGRAGLALSLLAAISLLPLTAADAGDRRERHRIQKQHDWKMVDRNSHRDRRFVHRHQDRRPMVIVRIDRDNGNHHKRFRNHRRQVDTYSGDVDIYSKPGVGTWSYGAMPSRIVVTSGAPSAKIIDVGKLEPNAACEMQAGVCVIEP